MDEHSGQQNHACNWCADYEGSDGGNSGSDYQSGANSIERSKHRMDITVSG